MNAWLALWILLAPVDGVSEVEKAAPPADVAAPADALRPTLAEIFKPPKLLGRSPRIDGISADGAFATYRWAEKDEDEPKEDLWLVRTDGAGEPRKLFTADAEVRTWWARHGALLVVLRDGWLETLDAASVDGATKTLPTTPLMKVGPAREPTFFKDGRRVALSAGGDGQVWVVDLVSGARSAPADRLKNRSAWFQVLEPSGLLAVLADRTPPPGSSKPEQKPKKSEKGAAGDASRSDGSTTDNSGASDGDDEKKRVLWLVPLDPDGLTVETRFEEGGRIDVSPDGHFVARSTRKSDDGRKLIMADYLTDQVTTVNVRSSLPGDDGFETKLELYSIEDEEAFEPPLDEASRFWTHQATWSKTGARLLVHRLSNDFHVRQVLVVDAEPRTGRLVFAERDDAWVGGPLLWAGWAGKTDTILFTSERSGWNHLYAHDLTTARTRPITDPAAEAEVHDLEIADDGARVVVLMNDPDPAQAHLFAYPVFPKGADATPRQRLTTGDGMVSRALLSRDASTVVYEQSNLGIPTELFAVRHDAPAPVALTTTIPAAYHEMAFPPPEIVEFENPDDGKVVRALLYKPQPFDPAKQYPAVLFIHGAGYLQNVTRSMTSYDVNMLFHHRLTRKGYVVLDPDYRHSKGYGRDFRADVYGFMGGKDLDDVVAGVEWLKKTGYVDGSKVGLYGGSYGGFLTLMALFKKPDVFACGAALRSVTDWRTYNAWYTNARLGDPEEEKENYERSSPIDHAEGLTKPLLILHGLKDSNVFAQDSIRLIEKLIELGKEFDAMLYPSQNHGFDDPESWIDEYKRIERWFDRHLKGES